MAKFIDATEPCGGVVADITVCFQDHYDGTVILMISARLLEICRRYERDESVAEDVVERRQVEWSVRSGIQAQYSPRKVLAFVCLLERADECDCSSLNQHTT